MSLRWAILGVLALTGSCKFFDPNENCLNPRASCFTPQTVAPYVVSYVPIPNRGSNTVNKLEGIQVTFSQRIKGWLDPDNYELANMGSLKIASIEQTGTYTVTLKLSGKLANGNADLSFPGLTNFTSMPFSKGTSLRLIGNLDIGVSILDSTSTHFVSSGGGLAKTAVAINWNHDYRIDPQNNNSYTLKLGGSSCADAGTISGGTNITGSNLPGNSTITSTIPLSGNFDSSGTYFVRICVQNNSGFNKSGEAVAIVVNDSSVPILQASIGNGAYARQQSVSISCTDNCVRIAYKVATGTSSQGTPSAPTFNSDGSIQTGTEFTGSWITPYVGDSTYSTLIAVAMDTAGNQSAPLVLSYQINSSLPVISFASPAASKTYVSGNSVNNSTAITWQANQSGNYQICLGGGGCTSGPGCGSGLAIGSIQPYVQGSLVETQIPVNGPPALASGNNAIHICVSNTVQVADSNLFVYRSDTLPTVATITPEDLSNAIPSAAPVAITIADPLALDLSTITTNTSDSSCSGTLQISSAADDFAPNTCVKMRSQPMAISSRTFLLSAADGFEPGIYKVRVTTGIRDIAGNTLASTYTSNTGFAVSGLMRQFTFNSDSTNIQDRAFTGFHLSAYGDPKKVNGVDGDALGAYKFDGSGSTYLSGLDNGLPLGQGPRTICAWVNTASRCGTNCVAMMYGASGGAYLGNRTSTSGYGFAGGADFLGGISLKLNTWTHLCHVYDGNNLRIFLNGVQDGAESSVASTTLGGGVVIGKASGTATQSAFNGRVDDVRIYAGALTPRSIRQMAVQVPTSLLLYYSFSDATSLTAMDYSNNGHNGTLVGNPAPSPDRFGTIGGYNFNSVNQWISASDTGLPSGTSTRTICSWIKPAFFPNSAAYAIALRYGKPSLGEGQTIGLYNNGTSTMVIYGSWGDDVTANLPIVLNTWMHVCGTYDGATATLYINGTKVGSFAKTWNTILSGDGQTFVGQGDSSGTTAFRGDIDDVRVYSRVLHEREITALSSQLGTALLRQYSFNYGQLTEDNGGPILTAVGGPFSGTGADGMDNGAFDLNGVSQYFAVADAGLPFGASPRTLCAWINPTSISFNGFALSYGQVATAKNSYLYSSGSTGTSFGSYVNEIATSAPIQKNSWTHICGVLDSSGNGSLYLNGNDSTSLQAIPLSFSTTSNGTLTIGARSDGTFPWSGRLDNVRIYGRGLSESEVNDLQSY
ncbi:MAG: Ig-like domain-containing protein [Turneriella sp.]|nr:Ig-like domain-containing protein [Turneriella sp.]